MKTIIFTAIAVLLAEFLVQPIAPLTDTFGEGDVKPGVFPQPTKVLSDTGTSPRSTVITLDSSGRSGNIVVSGDAHNMVLDVAFSHDARWLLAGRFRGQLDVWDTTTWSKSRSFRADGSRVTALTTSPNGGMAASGGDDNAVVIWRIPEGREIARVRGCQGYPNSLRFSPDGTLLAVNVNGGGDFLYDVDRRTVRNELSANDFRFTSSGSTLLTALAEKVTFWTVDPWTLSHHIPDPGGRIGKLALDEKAQQLVTGGFNGYGAKLWDLATGKVLAHFDAGYVDSLFFSVDGRWLYTAGDGYIRLWSLASNALVCASPKLGLWDLEMSNDSRWLAAGVDDTIHVWSVQDVMQECGLNHRAP